MNWPKTDFKWAPSVVEFKGKYYMYSSVPCQIWAAVSDTPVGPWRNLMGDDAKEMIPDQTPKGTIVLEDGTVVTLLGKPVIYAPADPLSYQRSSDFFYVAEKHGTPAIRVENGKTDQDKLRADMCASLRGVLRTKRGGERYIELTSAPTLGATRATAAVETKPDNLTVNGPGAVWFRAQVKETASDGKSFKLHQSAHVPEVTVRTEGVVGLKKLVPGNTVRVSDVITGGTTGTVLAREVLRLDPPSGSALAFYTFEDAGESATDSSGNAQHAKLVSCPTRVEGKRGKAIQLDGEKGYLQLPDLGLQPAITVSAWINLTEYAREGISSILHGDGWTWGELHFLVAKENNRGGRAPERHRRSAFQV